MATDADLFPLLQKKIRDHMNDTADHMSAGACADIEEYRTCCGIISGLALAERELLDMVKSYEEQD
tara:strand:- start:2480 stop:2677 length:198 start_codon:yes stop_codon:yes gene_type:complete